MAKAKEVLKRYDEGRRDFRGENLRSQSFKKANLAGADFSEADIRGANFAYANLRGAKFCGAKAGWPPYWAISNADLTDADFTNAMLKSTDLRKATLTCTCWRDSKKLDHTRPGESYLKDARIRKLVMTGDEQGQNFDHLFYLNGINLQNANLINANFSASDLSQTNLKGANLTDACLIETNLNAANLQDADLSKAKLVQAQLDKSNLTGATLTGAYIENWNITTETILNGVRCDYIFMRLPDGTSDLCISSVGLGASKHHQLAAKLHTWGGERTAGAIPLQSITVWENG